MKDTSISLPHTVVCMTTCWYSLSENSSYTLSKLSPHTAPVLYPPPLPPPLEECGLPFMRFAEHLSALRAWCKQCLRGW